MSSIKPKIYKKLVAEITLALIIFATPFLIQLHLLFDEIKSGQFLWWEYEHAYMYDIVFVWALLMNIVPQILLTIFFYVEKSSFRFSLLLGIWWLTYDTLLVLDFQHIIMFSLIPLILMILMDALWANPDIYASKRFVISRKLVGYTAIFVFLVGLGFIANLIPDDSIFIDLYFWQVGTFGFVNMKTFLLYLTAKLLVIIPMICFFFESKKWWRYAILSPILLTIYQLRNGLKSDWNIIDEYEIFEALPLLIFILVLVLFLSRAAYYQSRFEGIYKHTFKQVEFFITKTKFNNEETFLKNSKETWKRWKISVNSQNDEQLKAFKGSLEEELENRYGQ